MGDGAKGTFTALRSLYPPDEVQKAAQRMEKSIAERRSELGCLQGFIADNSDLIKLVRSLPDELSHEIMVPFGEAAFFPGRLIHTNEFLVLLGDGYYAERTAKQTVELLQRRGKALEAQVESLKATMIDLETEAKFFNTTAAEAAEGVVDIREYIEEPEKGSSGLADQDSLGLSKTDNLQKLDEDAEYARIMARLEELKKLEELEEGSNSDVISEGNKDLLAADEFVDDEAEDDTDTQVKHKSTDPIQKVKGSQMSSSIVSTQMPSILEQHLIDHPFTDSKIQFPTETRSSSDKGLSVRKEKFASSSFDTKLSISNIEDSSGSANQTSRSVSSDRKAFTGSIIENDLGLPPIQSAKSSSAAQSSGSSSPRPVSRFKMQKAIANKRCIL